MNRTVSGGTSPTAVILWPSITVEKADEEPTAAELVNELPIGAPFVRTVAQEHPISNHGGTEATAIVSIPLQLNQRVVGLIALFKLLPQKTGIEPVDQELFEVLSTHAARALHHAGLRAWARSQGVCL